MRRCRHIRLSERRSRLRSAMLSGTAVLLSASAAFLAISPSPAAGAATYLVRPAAVSVLDSGVLAEHDAALLTRPSSVDLPQLIASRRIRSADPRSADERSANPRSADLRSADLRSADTGSAPPDPPLANAGVQIRTTVAVGLALLLAGTALVLLTARAGRRGR